MLAHAALGCRVAISMAGDFLYSPYLDTTTPYARRTIVYGTTGPRGLAGLHSEA